MSRSIVDKQSVFLFLYTRKSNPVMLIETTTVLMYRSYTFFRIQIWAIRNGNEKSYHHPESHSMILIFTKKMLLRTTRRKLGRRDSNPGTEPTRKFDEAWHDPIDEQLFNRDKANTITCLICLFETCLNNNKVSRAMRSVLVSYFEIPRLCLLNGKDILTGTN